MDHNFLWIIGLIGHFGCSWSMTCTSQTDCVFQTDRGPVDLNPLAPDSKPTYTVTVSPYTYTFNPCKNFDIAESIPCTGVNACQQDQSSHYFPLGEISSMKCSDGQRDSDFIVQYEKDIRKSVVTVRCGDQNKLEFTNEKPANQYNFVLSTSRACFGGKGLSIGSILCIVFFITLAVYFIVGAIFMWWIREARGTDVIPNKDFWASLPGLIKDGISFTINKIRGTTDGDAYGTI